MVCIVPLGGRNGYQQAGATRRKAEGVASAERAHVWVEGRVQGVWFRESTRREAERLGLAGWVRNLPDGRVEAVFEGPAEKIGTAVAWCRGGPERAVVTHVEFAAEKPEGLIGFEVR
ncbi:MAG: acylphosphatase [Actinobacteria bacterium]|nr:MAG: acylphosphatase [Actinomycetota bacterium]